MEPLSATIAGIASVGGGLLASRGQAKANQKARDFAREQMRWTERQTTRAWKRETQFANTAVQRRVRDLQAAGLNPALAYMQGGAETPTAQIGGSAGAPVQSEEGAGVSTALAAKRAFEEMQMMKAQTKADIKLKKEQENATQAAAFRDENLASLYNEQRQEAFRARVFASKMEPHFSRSIAAKALLDQYAVPGAKNTADFENKISDITPGLSAAKTLAEIIKMLRGGR